MVTYTVEDGIAIAALDNPPVNALSLALRQGIVEAIGRAEVDPAVVGIVLIGSTRAFSAGADIREMGTANALAEPVLPAVIAAMEACGKPIVAAIGGVCMGGGLELAMGAHLRIALEGARLALPEVKLGLLPGAGGTQRFSRAVGLKRALEVILGGEPVAAASLAGTPLIARVVAADLCGAACELARAAARGEVQFTRLRDLAVEDPDPVATIAAARASASAVAHRTPAPLKIVESLEAAVKRTFADGLAFERGCYLDLRQTPAHRALRHAFTAERDCAKVPGIDAATPVRPVALAGVVGGGTMGRGIAAAFLNAGIEVVLREASSAALATARDGIAALYAAAIERGRITPGARDELLARLTGTLEPADLAPCDLVIEAVFEDMAAKAAVFSELDRVAKPGAILATNTSTLDVDEIAAATGRPGDVVGMHFFSPAHVMKLCEVVRARQTSAGTLASALAAARAIGKTPVVAGVCDGFIGNRMLEPYVRMAHTMVEEGARPAEVDAALEDFGMAMGPFRMGDLAGNDIGWAIRKRRYVERPQVRYARIADAICEAGRFGQKTAKGWYRYEAGSRAAIEDPEALAIIEAYRARNAIVPRSIAPAEIVERCIYALINEGARVLDEGIALRASDIDVVYLTGYGFPRFRGGPMRYGDEVGLGPVVARMEEFAAVSGDPFWTPAPRLARLAAQGGSLT